MATTRNKRFFSGRSDMTKWIRAALIAALAACAPGAFAQQANALETRLEARKVVATADGKEAYAPADQARPGDVIEYVATYRNTTRQPVRNLDATLPIPAETEFLPDTDKPAGARASLDGTTWGAMPLKRTVKRDGRDVEEAVPARDYRFLRWHTDTLGAEKSAAFTARVRVIDDRGTGPPGGRGGGR
jgi:uncharacterized repeat protein (TIGR01451 family)